MRVLLASLMCLVLFESECFALKGGPVFGGRFTSVVGTYAGVLTPIPTLLPSGIPGDPPIELTDNSLALFTLQVPQTGLASGASAIFRNGIFYTGTIQGSADPDTAKLTGVLNAVFLQVSSVTSSGSTSIIAEYDATGGFTDAKIKANKNGLFSSAATRIKGEATLTYTNFRNDGQPPDSNGDSGGPIQYKISAFKQSQSSG